MSTRVIQVKLETTTDGQLRAVLADASKGAKDADKAVDSLNQALREKEAADKAAATSGAEQASTTREQGAAATTATGAIDRATKSTRDRTEADTAATAAMKREQAALDDLLARYDPVGTELRKLEQDEKALQAAMAKGALTQEQYGKAMNNLSARRSRWMRDTDKMAKSTKEMEFALRLLPAQITDIGVGLATGQSPFYILMQQGGQLKDMFGGMGPAIKAVGGYVARLVNPFTLAAAAAAGLFVAWEQGQAEMAAYDKALAMTGHSAGVTTGTLKTMAEQLDTLPGVTEHAAAGVLALVVSSGKFSGTAIPMVAHAAVEMQQATGQAIDKTIGDFEKLGASPVQAIVELNDKQHFLTLATYEQIRALADQGKQQQAAAVAQRAYADAVDRQTKDVRDHLGWLEKGWNAVAAAAKEAWDGMLDVGRADSLADKVADVKKQLDNLGKPHLDRAGNLVQGSFPEEAARLRAELQKLRQQQVQQGFASVNRELSAQATQDAIEARQGLAKYASPKLKRDSDLQAAKNQLTNALYGVTDKNERARYQAEYQRQVDQINATYKKASGGSTAGLSATEHAYDQQLKAIENRYANHTKVLASDRRANLIDETSYYHARLSLITQHEQAETQAIDKELADLRSRKASGAEQVKINQKITGLEHQRQQATAQANAERKQADNDHLRALQQEKDAVAAYVATLEQSLATRRQAIDNQESAVGMGSQEAAYEQRLNGVHRDVDNKLGQLNLQRNAHQIGDSQYRQELQKLRDYETQRVQMEQDGYRRLQLAQSNWKNGATAALENYRDNAANIAGQTADAFTGAFGDMENALVQWADTGKLSLEQFASDFAHAVMRMEIRALEAKAATALLNWMGLGAAGSGAPSGGASWSGGSSLNGGTYMGEGSTAISWGGMHASGGPIHGPGTTTSDSILMRASRGEYVIRAAAVQHYGQGTMDAINHMTAPGFAMGGPVGGARPAGGAGRGNTYVTIEDHSGGDKPQVKRSTDGDGNEFIRVIIDQAANEVDRRIMRRDSTYHAIQNTFGVMAHGNPIGA